jgi:hypothetical protein
VAGFPCVVHTVAQEAELHSGQERPLLARWVIQSPCHDLWATSQTWVPVPTTAGSTPPSPQHSKLPALDEGGETLILETSHSGPRMDSDEATGAQGPPSRPSSLPRYVHSPVQISVRSPWVAWPHEMQVSSGHGLSVDKTIGPVSGCALARGLV